MTTTRRGPGPESEAGHSGRVARRVVVSLAIGGLTYLLTNVVDPESQQSTVAALTLSVFLGGVILVVQLLIDFDSRLRTLQAQQIEQEKSMRELVRRAFVQINEATKLFGLLEESAVRTDAVTQLVRHATNIKPGNPDLLYDFAQVEIGRTSQFLKALAGGMEVTCEGEDRDWLIGLTESATVSIDATSFTTVDAGGRSLTDGFWGSDLSKRYLQAQREAVARRKMTVRRIFILDRPELGDDPGLTAICQEQAAFGIQVRVLDYGSIHRAHTMALRDFILFDGVISYETVASPTRVHAEAPPTILNTKLVLDAAQVRKRIDDFDYLWSHATPFDPTAE